MRKSSIRGLQTSRQSIDGKTNEMENNSNKAGHSLVFDAIRQVMIKSSTSSARLHGHKI